MTKQLNLRYGMNPHQQPARISVNTGALPITVLNGQPGYINLLDALNAWQLVRDLKGATGMASAASFKHVSPAGAAVGEPLSELLRQIYFVGDGKLSPLAMAYARARGADRLSSFGDWIALSDTVDVATARLIRREVSDGVIAPAYEPAALDILCKKKKGGYRVIQVDADFVPEGATTQELFGITFEQTRNDYVPKAADFTQPVTANKTLSDDAKRDMLVALVALKYTQSNSVVFAKDGQLIGVGAGQQSRVHCVRLAATKAETWWLRQHPRVLELPFAKKIGRAARDNAIDQFLLEAQSPIEEAHWLQNFSAVPKRLTQTEKRAWLNQLTDVTLGSDAFFPFRDSIDRASQTGVRYVVQPGGSLRDESVITACDQYGMTMVFNGVRLFHH